MVSDIALTKIHISKRHVSPLMDCLACVSRSFQAVGLGASLGWNRYSTPMTSSLFECCNLATLHCKIEEGHA
jgi:hypothetical protein